MSIKFSHFGAMVLGAESLQMVCSCVAYFDMDFISYFENLLVMKELAGMN